MLEKLKVYVVLALLMFALYLLVMYLTGVRDKEVLLINENYSLTKGVVIDKSVYKGHSIKVKYEVNNKFYIGSDAIDATNKIDVGDTIDIKYSITKPELMITEFNEQF